VIGGEYFIKLKEVEDSLLYDLSLVCPSYAYYSSGRDAIYTLLSSLPTQHIWLPDFIYQAAVDVANQAEKEIHFYPINEQLLPEENWISNLHAGDIVFVVHLFGIAQTALLNKLAQTEAVVISDMSQTLYHLSSWQTIASHSSYLVSSLRKTMPLPDGAFLASKKYEIPLTKESAIEDFWALRAAALLSRSASANQGFMSNENYLLFKKAEQWLDSNPAAARKISDCSRFLLTTESVHEWETQRQQTHHNQAILAIHLTDHFVCPQVKLTATLPEIAISNFFPILVDPAKRTQIRTSLAEKRIYCPIHWDTSFLKTEHELSKKILSIPCDARYNSNDIKYVAASILAL
jgi:hypothetical protein